jgi:phosphoribosylamine--glycine ligase
MKILLIGSGGREHALAWKIAQSELLTELVIAPGNPGMWGLGEIVSIKVDDCDGLMKLIIQRRFDLVVVGPELPLALGLADLCEKASVPCFGPIMAAAKLEASKAFTKSLCDEMSIPTAKYGRFTVRHEALDYLMTLSPPYVIKADGLAAGKGVVVTTDLNEAKEAIRANLSETYSDNELIVIEEFLKGSEASVFALCDGKDALIFGAAQDHKRAFDNDKGPNTGGMGTFSPSFLVDQSLENKLMRDVITPTLEGLMRKSIPYRGVLFAGLMIDQGAPCLIEYNVRFGDPECQVLMLRLKSDLLPYLMAAALGSLSSCPPLEWHEECAVCVVYAAENYPDAPVKGSLIVGLDHDFGPHVTIFHAGTATNDQDQIVVGGGRVLNICAKGKDLSEARARAYEAISHIHIPKGHFRRDIGAFKSI